MAGRKLKCKETGRIAELVKAASQNEGEVLLRYEDGSEVAVMPFELEVKYQGYVAARNVTTNPFRR